MVKKHILKDFCPGWIAHLVRALPQYGKVVGSIPSQGTYKIQPVEYAESICIFEYKVSLVVGSVEAVWILVFSSSMAIPAF